MTTAATFRRSWRSLPVGTLDDIIGSGRCLVLAPHPDDESLGCGGLIAMCSAVGRAPLVAVLTDGAQSHPDSRAFPAERLRALRATEAREAVSHLGLPESQITFLNEPDGAAPHAGPKFDAVVAWLTGLIRAEMDCTAILAPWRHDPHCDHEAASLIAAAVADSCGVQHVSYPVWGWTLPAATSVPGALTRGWRLDIGAFLAAKRAAIRAHRSQYGDLIMDDPTGFCLPSELLAVFLDSAYETFVQP